MGRAFQRVAIVNRGEAAMRFVHAARELSLQGVPIRSIAFYTEPERDALFVREADEAVSLGPATFVDARDGQTKSAYLDYCGLERALVASRADAAWVGWGFVAEHPGFADLCDRLGIVFIGPPGEVMRKLGDKITSKLLAERAGVPVLPWSGGPVESVFDAKQHAARLGYPVLIKATAGGGGRGIRLISSDAELPEAFERARTEALKAFGDPTVFLERCAQRARHVEVQIIADDEGTTWAVGTRDCTVQRRKQKLVEESPCPALSPATDRALREAAVQLAREAGYRNAGTVEFLFDSGTQQYWFMEVNTRLQVEHPVTELTSGLDLVQLQLRVARGERLEGDPPPQRGHAIEVRLNAEDPDAGFAPAPGEVEVFRFAGGPGLRVDSGVTEGDVVPQEFDSMLAKVIAWGPDRASALARLRRALAQSTVVVRGGSTNRTFMLELLNRPEIVSGEYDTEWLDGQGGDAKPRAFAAVALIRAAIEAYDADLDVERSQFLSSAARGRPEASREIGRTVELGYGGQSYKLRVCQVGPGEYTVDVDDHRVAVRVERRGTAPMRERRAQGAEWRMTLGGQSHRVLLVVQGLRYVVEVNGIGHQVSRDDAGIVRCNAPALVVSVPVSEGDLVAVGDRLAVLEAMKMEVAVAAPFAGRVREVRVKANVQVGAGTPLIVLEPMHENEADAGTSRVRFEVVAAASDEMSDRPRGAGTLRALGLGYDVDTATVREAIRDWKTPCGTDADGPDAEAAFACECEVLEIFADLCSLFVRRPGEENGGQVAGVSAEELLFSYLRTLDASAERLSPGFLESVRRSLAHYGVARLERSEPLLESLFRIFKAHQRTDEMIAPVSTILERWLDRAAVAQLRSAGRVRQILDRMIASTHQRFPSLNDLAREVRYRYFEQPLLEHAREAIYRSARADLDRLADEPHGPDRQSLIDRLVEYPQPLASLLMGRFGTANGTMRQVMLEVLTRRYYRIRTLRNVRTLSVDGHMFTLLEYDEEGRHVQAVTTHADFDRCAQVLELAYPLLGGIPEEDEVELDLYAWREGPLGDPEADQQAICAVLNETQFPRPVRRIVVAVSGPHAGLGTGGMQHFTYPRTDGRYAEDRFYRGAHPLMSERLHLWRLTNFDIERLPSPEDVYVMHSVAHDNPRDERFISVAEVRDMTAVRDATGRIVHLPQFERMLMEALAGIRRAQAKRPPDRRLHWNRVLLYVWPPFMLSASELDDLVGRIVPVTEGLGIEHLVIRARVPGADGALEDTVITIANPDTALTVTFGAPPTKPMRTLSPYEQKVVRCRQQGTVYPYELIRMIAPPQLDAASTASEFAPGRFAEYDLDEHRRLVPVSRPWGQNTSNIVTGVIRNFTEKYPDGMTRVILLGDPSRDLGALAEPECRRIIAALDLAQQKQVPVEWFALSAGAKISMDSGTENMDWIALVLRRIVNFTQHGGEINIVVNGINVGAQPYWNAEATMLMHTRGILVMMPESAMVLTGKRALDYSGGVSAEDNQGIGGFERIMGPNGQAQYYARDLAEACRILLWHYEHTHISPGEVFPRRAVTLDPADRDVCAFPYGDEQNGFARVGDIFSDATNPGRKRPFDIRKVMAAVVDQDHAPLERWKAWRDAETTVVWDAHLGGHSVALLGIESRPVERLGFVPADGPDQWTAGTLFPQSSRKLARAINAANGNRPVVVLANLTGFDGSPESLRMWQLEYGAEIGRAVVNFSGPIIFCVISRYHGGAFVVFSNALNPNLEVAALEGTYASVIGGAPAAAVVFAREVERRATNDERLQQIDRQIGLATGQERARLRAMRAEIASSVRSEKLGEVADEFDHVHSVQRARQVGSVHRIVPPARLRPYLIDAVERGIQRELTRVGRDRHPSEVFA